MKEFMRKTVVILVLMLMLINSSLLTLISVAVEEIENILDTSKINAQVEIDIEKYVNYAVEEKEGVLLKLNLSTGIKYDEEQEYKQIKTTTTELIAPQINDEYPEKIEVQAISTKATNGSDVAKDWQYGYDEQTGKISIVALNEEKNNVKVDDARDIYKLNLYYSSNCYDAKNSTKNLEILGKTTEVLDVENFIQITGDINKSIEVSENISGLVSADITTSDIYNGNIYANINNEANNPTEYTELMDINVDYASISDEIEINEDDKFINTNNLDVNTEDIVYKGTKVNKKNILDILGEDGKLQILNSNKEILLEVDKETQAQEDGTIKVDFENAQSVLIIKTSKPIKVGTIKIENTKLLKETALDINNNRVKTETSVKAINNIKQEKEIKKQEIYNFINTYEKEIKESTTRIDLSVNKEEWTNNTVNDINFTLNLVSNDIKYNLFNNPIIEIKLPEDVDKVILGETSLLNNDESNFNEHTELTDDGTNKIIKVILSGVQKNYITNAIYEGICVIVPTKITLKGDLTTLDSNIEVTYSNQNGRINDYELEENQKKIVNIKELDEKQEARLSMVRYNLNVLSAENIGNSTDTVNEEQNTEEKIEKIDGLTFSTVAQVGNKILNDGDIVYEKQIITYRVKITNNSSTDFKNLNIIGKIPEGTTYVTVSYGIDDVENMEKMYEYVGDSTVTEKTITIDSIEKGSSIEKIFEVEVNKLDTNTAEKNITSNTALYSNGKKIAESSINNVVKKSDIYARMVSTMGGFENEDNQWEYYVLITNNTQEVLNDVDVSVNIPKWLSIYETGSLTPNVEVTNETNENGFYKAKVSELPIGTEVILRVYMQPENLEKNVYLYDLEVAAEINTERMETYNTNLNMQTMLTREVVVTMSSESEGKEVKFDDEIEYDVNIKVNGSSRKFKDIDLNVLDYLPDELIPEEVEYEIFTYNEETENYEYSKLTEDISSKIVEDDEKTSPDVKLFITIPNGLETNIKIKAKADLISENKEVSNSVSVTTGESDTIISNIVKFTILAGDYDNDESESDTPTYPDEDDEEDTKDNEDKKDEENIDKGTYEISGQVWIDTNKDGRKDDKEQKVSGVKVKLFNMATNAIVTNPNGEKYIITTDKEGKYKFSNLPNGKYLVIFEYDSNIYELTDYQKNGVSEDNNSDVIKKEISIDGKEEIAGVTDAIIIESNSKQNIDAGLIKGSTLDFKLDKYVSKITVANSKGTKDYDYQEQKLAKVEIASKEIADTKVTITFKIVVTNEGEKSAYISEITDYLPEGLTLDSVDGNWEVLNDGSVKIYALSGMLLKPGASKEIELKAVATDIGRFINGAEITLTKSDGNPKDIDSTEGNKDKKEDDYSEATVIISVKTGAIIGASMGIIIAIILVILFAVLFKKNKKFKKHIKMSVLLLLATSTITIGITTSQAKTVAEKKEELKEKYTTSTTYNINSGSSHFYTHDTPMSKVINSGRLHCANGSKAMCGSGSHYYKQKSVKVTKFDVKTTKSTANKYTANPNKSEGKKLNDSYNIFGPYKITRTNEGKITADKIKSTILYNTNGNAINSSKWKICDRDGNSKEFSFNKEFYIKVDKNLKVSNMKIKIENASVTSYKAEWKVVEQWICYQTSGGQHHTSTGRKVPCGNTSSAQPLERVWTGKDEWTNTTPVIKTITLYLKKETLEEGGAKIKKLDDRDQTPLQGVEFSFSTKIKTYDWYASEDIYHRVDRGWYVSYSYPIYDANGKLIGNGWRSYWHSNWVTEYWYTENYYHWVEHTAYLGNDRQWAYSEGSFYTDENGIASGSGTLSLKTEAVNDGSLGNNHTVYAQFVGNTITAIEKSVSGEYYGYDKNIGNFWNIQRDGEATVKAYNHQYEVMLSGYVWLDEQNGKLSMTDSEFNGESGLNGIVVKLKDRSGAQIKTTYTSELGIYDEITGGEYRFEHVNLDAIQRGEYHVEFEYCGIDYQSVNPELDSYEGSKAVDTNTRSILDGKFLSVNGNGSQNLNVNGVSLNYNQNNQYISTINGHSGCTVYASTEEAGYDLYSDFIPTSKEIKYVNLGLFKKAQTDYAIAQDLYNVRVGVNGFQHVYRYASTRYNADGEYTDEESSWNVGVKFNNNRGSYSRAIYKADYEYDNKEDASKNINVYVTYKVSLKNEGPYLGRVNSIVDYCDSNYELENIGYSINDEDVISNKITTYREENSPYGGYKKFIIDTSSRTIDEGEEQCLYIQFKMNKQAILTIMNNGEAKHNLVEINSYTTFDDDTGKTIAVYDKDSVPATAKPENFNTYEDDTDSAKSLQLVFKNERSVEGTVFIDSTGKEGQEAVVGEERKGDGEYQEGQEDTVKENQVKITMQEVDEQGNKKLNGLVYTTSTDKNGKFEISGFVAGYYQITYTWGDKEYKVQYYKGTIYNDKARSEKTQKDSYWYRGLEYDNDTIKVTVRRTDALDNYKRREDIDNQMRYVTNNTLESMINNAYTSEGQKITKPDGTVEDIITSMDSTTPTMAFSVEYETTVTNGDDSDRIAFVVNNIDFGIVERAKQALDFSKRITGYKITLANDQVLVDAKIDEKGNLTGIHEYTTYLKPSVTESGINIGQLKTEMDNELIEGATLETTYEMKVTNVGELDYSTADYYYYGIKDENNIVTVSVMELLDYVDGRLNNLDPDKQWIETDQEHLKEVNASMKNNTDINKYRTYLTKELAKPLIPSKDTTKNSNTIELHTSKLLTFTDDNTFNNKSEISQVTKNEKGFIGTPVKLIENYFNIGDSEEIIIIPSTGENKNYIVPIIIGIISITILGGGIILIKKFVIDK